MLAMEQVLQDRFGLGDFRRGQREIIESVVAGKDVMAVLPTGGGKSLCYQLPALLKDQLVVVISPLIALMKDQVENLRRRGLPAGCLHSGQSDAEKRGVFGSMAEGGAYVLYLSPERVQKEGFQRWIRQQKIALFAVDEAHCVSQWGHDFRQEYTQLKSLKAWRPDVPVLALTASATPLVLSDVERNLNLSKPERHVHGFYRPNLYYQVEPCANEDEKFSLLKQALRQTPTGRIIVYCGTRKVTESVAQELSREFEGVACYHAGLNGGDRNEIQASYGRGDVRILVATNAFGMGIDHPDVRLVVHFNMPANIDSLYQEMGRAGRDGKDSTCILLYMPRDKGLQGYFITSSEAPAEIKRSRWNTLNALVAYAEGGECRHAEILTYYKDSQRLKACGHCDSCLPASPRKIGRPVVKVIDRETSSSFAKASKRRAPRAAEDARPLDPTETMRFELLKDWRREKAAELDVPAFVIFSDRTLREVAQKNPMSISALLGVHGFGDVKVERFGRDVLTALGNV